MGPGLGPSGFQLGVMGDAGRLCAMDHRSKPLNCLVPTNLGTGTRDVDGRTSLCPDQLGVPPIH